MTVTITATLLCNKSTKRSYTACKGSNNIPYKFIWNNFISASLYILNIHCVENKEDGMGGTKSYVRKRQDMHRKFQSENVKKGRQ
jgi:hypothetical protein